MANLIDADKLLKDIDILKNISNKVDYEPGYEDGYNDACVAIKNTIISEVNKKK